MLAFLIYKFTRTSRKIRVNAFFITSFEKGQNVNLHYRLSPYLLQKSIQNQIYSRFKYDFLFLVLEKLYSEACEFVPFQQIHFKHPMICLISFLITIRNSLLGNSIIAHFQTLIDYNLLCFCNVDSVNMDEQMHNIG